jgi:DNA-binding PadR family transcriptional regulator
VGTSLGEFEQLILLALVRLGTDAYGVRMRKEIEARTGREISAGAIYTALERLEGRGFVSSHLGEPTPVNRSYDAFTQMTKGLGPRLHALASDAKPKA